MKAIFIITTFLILLTACATQPASRQAAPMDHDVPDLPSEGAPTNADLFGHGLDVRTDTVSYGDFSGYLAEPATEGMYPGVVMIHEWWGLNDNIKDMAASLAAQGYTVLAVDLYDGSVATTRDEASELVGSFDQERGVQNMDAATEFLRARGAQRVGSLGWCFGGGQSLQVSLATPLDATVIYYGNLETEAAALSSLQGPVLGIFGAADSSIPVDAVNEFDAALNEVGVSHAVHIYEGVGHAFANPSGSNFAEDETRDAWAKTLVFLNESLR